MFKLDGKVSAACRSMLNDAATHEQTNNKGTATPNIEPKNPGAGKHQQHRIPNPEANNQALIRQEEREMRTDRIKHTEIKTSEHQADNDT